MKKLHEKKIFSWHICLQYKHPALKQKAVNPIHGSGLFLYFLKTSGNQRFFSGILGNIGRDRWHEMGQISLKHD